MKGIKPADIILIVLLIIICFIPLLVLNSGTGKSVSVSVDGNVLCELSLDKDTEYTVDGVGKVIVEQGAVYVTDMNCPNKFCEHSGKIHSSGNTIVCLPNRLIVTVNGETEVDAVVG